MDDLINRQAAIAAIQNLYPGMPTIDVCNSLNRWHKKNKQYIECEDAINKLPSAQPEKVCIANITLSEEQVLEAVEKAKSEIIQLLPSTQPERKKGKWIKYDNGTYYCSLCQSWIPNEQRHYANYCLFCGADMRGETDG